MAHRTRTATVSRLAVLATVAAAHFVFAEPPDAPARPSPLPLEQPSAPRNLAIIVNKSNSVDRLSRSELRRIFLLETQTWPHGRKITVVIREKGQPERTEALELICEMRESDFDRHVLFQTFRGSIVDGPRAIHSASAMLRFVFNAPGAIGYVYADEVDDSAKVVRIDGLLPGEPGYVLRRPARTRERNLSGH